MIIRMLILLLAFGSSLTSPLFAGAERGNHLVGEVGGVRGAAGAAGVAGLAGIAGVAGTSAVLDFGDFYVLDTDPQYSALLVTGLAAGAAMPFPHNGATSSGGVTRTGDTTFQLAAVGTYLVQFEVTAANAAQLQLRLNGAYIANSVVGRATGQTQIVGISLVTTTTANSILEVVNPPGNTVLTLPAVGSSGAQTFSDHLSIMRIQ